MSSAALPNAARAASPIAPPPARPWRALGYAALVLVLSGLAGLLFARASFAFGRLIGMAPTPDTAVHVMIATIGVTETTAIALVLGRVRWTRGGDIAMAVSAGPVHRRWLLALLVAGELAFLGYNLAAVLGAPACAPGLRAGMSASIVAAARAGPGWLALFLGELAILTPVAEELLFRGWLWAALRRSWGAWPTALVTGGLFWLMHAPYGLRNFLLVLPVAVILTAVRQVTGSIRGTILLHALQDGGAAVLTLVLLRGC